MILKKKRETDKGYISYVINQPCLVCYAMPCDPHHTKTVGSFGSDYTVISLCRKHHTECHQIGKNTFQEKYGIDFDTEIIKLLIGYIKEME